MDKELKRISLLIREDQYQRLGAMDLNLSGLVRDMIDDFLSESKITLSVSGETRDLYSRVVSNTGSTDEDLEKYLRTALAALLRDRIKGMEKLYQSLGKDELSE